MKCKILKHKYQTANLVARLNTSRDTLARETIQKLKLIGKRAVPVLIDAAQNSTNPRIRKWALSGLGELKDKQGFKVLVHALKDPQMTIRLHATRALGKLGDRRAGRHLMNLLSDKSGGIRINVIDAIASLSYRPAETKIIPLLKDKKWYVRQHAAIALGIFKSRKASSALKNILKTEKRKAVVIAIKTTLKKIE